jgi:acyl-CoA reductase-like NAD-dependent aldehyde dehydrogenase
MDDRLEVRKTYKLFVGGEFPRSESGRAYAVEGVWAARASRKDVRDAVRAARGALAGWAAKTAYNRGQILYRVAEVLEGRRAQLVAEGCADDEVSLAIDRWVWYAGWTDKIAALFGTVNPIAGPYFDFTIPEPVGVVGIIAPSVPPLLGITSRVAPVLAGGNTCVALASEHHPRAAISFAEVLATSDVPPGVVNILTGRTAELSPWLAGHLDVDSLDLTGAPPELAAACEAAAAEGVTRTVRGDAGDQSPYDVVAFMEMKTVWHPVAP